MRIHTVHTTEVSFTGISKVTASFTHDGDPKRAVLTFSGIVEDNHGALPESLSKCLQGQLDALWDFLHSCMGDA